MLFLPVKYGSQLQLRCVCVLLLVFTGCVPGVLASSPRCKEERCEPVDALARSIDKVVRDKIHQDSIPGLALTVVEHGKPLFTRCYGYASTERKEPVSPKTVFALASVSKLFTTVAMFAVLKKRNLSVNNSVRSLLPSFPVSWSDVHVIHLLSHTSGLPTESADKTPLTGSFSRLIARNRSFSAGEKVEYNNIGFAIAGNIIEHQTGQRLDTFFSQTIFRPLHMCSTRIPNELFPADLASGYRMNRAHPVPYKNYQPWSKMGGSAGVVSCLEDMILFEEALLTKAILDQRSYAIMYRPVVLSSGAPSGWCCGWEISGSPSGAVYHKHGNIGGYSSWYGRDIRDGLSIIILSNCGGVKYEELDARIRQLVRRSGLTGTTCVRRSCS